jgi:hypothetical protein
VVFAIALGLVAFILPRGHAVAGRLATQAVPVETDD